MLKNERGAVHIVSLLLLVLALFGAWSLYRSYQEQQRLQASVMEAVRGYQQIIKKSIRDPQERKRADQYLEKIQDILERNQSRRQDR